MLFTVFRTLRFCGREHTHTHKKKTVKTASGVITAHASRLGISGDAGWGAFLVSLHRHGEEANRRSLVSFTPNCLLQSPTWLAFCLLHKLHAQGSRCSPSKTSAGQRGSAQVSAVRSPTGGTVILKALLLRAVNNTQCNSYGQCRQDTEGVK